jgi:5-methylcytosine-specific restriction endonuclease McrA
MAKEQICRCGTGFKTPFKSWTQCAACYWKDQSERRTKRLLELKDSCYEKETELRNIESRITAKQSEIHAHIDDARKSPVLIRRLLFLAGYRGKLLERLQVELRRLEYEKSRIPKDLERLKVQLVKFRSRANSAKRQFEVALSIQDSAATREKEKDKFKSACVSSLHIAYTRENFHILKRDYKAGNRIENYVRKQISVRLFETFGNACAACGEVKELTLDHFAIPKNEGGNFLLFAKETKTLHLNIVPLCRPCNSRKGDRDYIKFFTIENLEVIRDQHARLLEVLLNDREFMAEVGKWFRIYY